MEDQTNIQQTPVDPSQLELADGTTQDVAPMVQDSSEIDAIPVESVSQQFESGNFNQLTTLRSNLDFLITTLSKTIEPLAEAALIELLGNDGAFHREVGNVEISMMGSVFVFDTVLKYKVANWIGDDIDNTDVMHDAKYVLDKMKVVQGVEWKTCAIDTSDGVLSIEFTTRK